MGRIPAEVAAGIADGRFDPDAETGSIDFLGGQEGAVEHRSRDKLIGSRRGEQKADFKFPERHTHDPTQQARLFRLNRPRRTLPSTMDVQIGWRRSGIFAQRLERKLSRYLYPVKKYLARRVHFEIN